MNGKEDAEGGNLIGKKAVEFKDGHKSFNTMETEAISAYYLKERQIREHFEREKSSMIRPRNPIHAEATPRDGQGILLIDSSIPQVDVLSIHKESTLRRRRYLPVTGKIGNQDELYITERSPNRPAATQKIDSSVEFLTSIRKRKETLESQLSKMNVVLQTRKEGLNESLRRNYDHLSKTSKE